MIDKKALQILTKTYWASGRWRDKPETSKEDFAYAKDRGLMFDPVKLTHDQALSWLQRSLKKVNARQVAGAFLASLTSRRLDLRSALGSYAMGRWLPQHPFQSARGSTTCSLCGEYAGGRVAEDLSVLNFERFKWGGVRHDSPLYNALDLERLSETEIPPPTPADVDALRKILAAAESLPAKARPGQLLAPLASLLPSSKDERQTLLAILGYAGILQPKSQPSFEKAFVKLDDRSEDSTEWHFPVCFWRGADGVNRKAAESWFPQL
jgi:hypothetical protein